MSPSRIVTIAALVVLLSAGAARAGAILQPTDSPEWQVSEWIHGNPGAVADHQGRVIIIHFFQLWCPVSNSFSVPLLQRWNEVYGGRNDVLIVGIHTVFEGHAVQGPAALGQFLDVKGITYPVGIDAYAKDDPLTPVTMQRFKNEGTPQIAIVDKKGQLRFSHFGVFEPAIVESFIDRLLKEPGPPPGTAKPAGPARNEALSGRYRVNVAQGTKTCGRLIPPITVEADVTVTADQVKARFLQGFLGINDINAKFDPETMRFELEARRRTSEQGASVNLLLQLQGSFKRGTSPQEFEYRFSFDKDGDDPGWECKIDGTGRGIRMPPAPRGPGTRDG